MQYTCITGGQDHRGDFSLRRRVSAVKRRKLSTPAGAGVNPPHQRPAASGQRPARGAWDGSQIVAATSRGRMRCSVSYVARTVCRTRTRGVGPRGPRYILPHCAAQSFATVSSPKPHWCGANPSVSFELTHPHLRGWSLSWPVPESGRMAAALARRDGRPAPVDRRPVRSLGAL